LAIKRFHHYLEGVIGKIAKNITFTKYNKSHKLMIDVNIRTGAIPITFEVAPISLNRYFFDTKICFIVIKAR